MMTNNERIRLRAYEIWINEGQPEGRELEHWLQARREVLGESAEDGSDSDERAEIRQPAQTNGAGIRESTELG